MIDLPFPDVPARPLRAIRLKTYRFPRNHAVTCPHAWIYVSPLVWTDDQRAHARYDYSGPRYAYVSDCPGCDDLIAWHQDSNARAIKRVLTPLHEGDTLQL